MPLEDLYAFEEAAAEEAADQEQAKRLMPPTEAMSCTLQSGAKVVFDVPNTRKR